MSTRLCEVCGEPLPANLHGNTVMHKECYKQKQDEAKRQWRQTHPELMAEYTAKYNRSHPDKARERRRRWSKKNKGKKLK